MHAWLSISHVLNKILHPAMKVRAKLVQRVSPSRVPTLVQDFRKRHPVDFCCSGDLLDRQSTTSFELHFFHQLG